jgi:guanyl-specific ribonuclease Sa
VITTQPNVQPATVGQEVNLSVVATESAISYQWKKDGVNIDGKTTSTLNIPSAQVSDTGNYTVEISNILGTVTSNVANLTVNAGQTAVTLSSATAINDMNVANSERNVNTKSMKHLNSSMKSFYA